MPEKKEGIVVTRIEELYPFPQAKILEALEKTPNAQTVWLQEEPYNAGAYSFMRERFGELGIQLAYVGRAPSASPATGSSGRHKVEQEAILNAVTGSPKELERHVWIGDPRQGPTVQNS